MKKWTLWKLGMLCIISGLLGIGIASLPDSRLQRELAQKQAERDFQFNYAKGDVRFRAITICFTSFPGLNTRSAQDYKTIDQQGFINFYSGDGMASGKEALLNSHKTYYAQRYNQLLLTTLKAEWNRKNNPTKKSKNPFANL